MSLPDTIQTLQIDGHKMTYYRVGSGETIILVHGITTYSFIWRNIFPRLAEKYDVIAIDLLGCGDSDKPLDISYAIKDHAEMVHELVTILGIEKFHFVGHDLGGGIGQIYATSHQENLFSLTVINTVAYDFWPVQPVKAMRTPIIRQFLMAALDMGTFRLIVKRGLYHKEKVNDELMELFMKPMGYPEGRKAFLHFARCLDNDNLLEISDALKKLRIPVLIIRGDADAYLSEDIAIQLNRNIHGSKLIHIETGGHFIQEDEPELIAASVDNFISHPDR